MKHQDILFTNDVAAALDNIIIAQGHRSHSYSLTKIPVAMCSHRL